MSEKTVKRCIPFVLTVIVLVLDQLTKYLVTSRIPLFSIGASFFGDIIRIIHVIQFAARAFYQCHDHSPQILETISLYAIARGLSTAIT